MKKNINLMQSNSDIDSEFLNQLGKEHILQALANLGQRIGIKGDGLKYESFKFIELLNNEERIYSEDEYIGYVEYINNKAIFGVKNINTKTDILLENLTDNNINNVVFSNNEFSFTIPVNNIEKYSKNSIVSIKDNILTVITVGKKIGYSDDDDNNAVLMYYKFNILTNKLICAIKSSHIYSDNNNDYYFLLKINQKCDDDGIALNNKYELTTKIFNAKYENDYYKQSFINSYCFDNFNTNDLNKRLTLPFLISDFIDIENLEDYNYNINTNYDSNSPISIILNNTINSNYNYTYKLDINLDNSTNQFFSVNETTYKDIINLYKKEYNFVNIIEEINFFNNDITEFYENIFKYYNEKFYLNNRITFIKRIICMLYEHIYKDLFNNDNTITYSDIRLYIPLNYAINYICNSNNELNIYYSNDLYVLYTNLDDVIDISSILKNNNYLIVDYNSINKVKSYKFEIEYNNKYEDIINGIDIKNIYTMPYVDTDENWNINDYNTNIRAIGKDAGNPNIIIIYSIDKEKYKVLSAVSNKLDINVVNFKLSEFKLHKNLFSNLLHNDNTKCYAWIPVLTKDNYKIFENSIILNISDLNCLDNINNKEYYLGSNVITIWNYIVDNNTYDFKVITNDDKYVIPLGVTHNLESILNETTLLNLNEQDLLILKAKLTNTIGQEISGNTPYNWNILRNKNSEEYNAKIVDSNNLTYGNDLNTILEYTDNLNISNSKATYSSLEKYIKDINSISDTDITNILYPIYDIEQVTQTKSVNKILYDIKKSLENVESLKLTVNGNTYLVQNDIYNIISSKLQKTITTSTIEYSTNIVKPRVVNGKNQYYNEYVFNINVPNIDFKEIFLRNVNTLNRYNIITLDKFGNTYYSYLGADYNDDNKNVLHLGSSTKNINIGTDSLMNNNDTSSFKTQDTISIDFDNIILNGQNTITFVKPKVIDKLIGSSSVNKHYYTSDYNIIDILFPQMLTKTESFLNPIVKLQDDEKYDMLNTLENRYRIIYDNDTTPAYYIYLNGVIKDIFDINIEDVNEFKKIHVESGTNQMITLINEDNSTTGNFLTVPKFLIKINDPLTRTDIIEKNNMSNKYSVLICTDTLSIVLFKDSYNINIMCKFNKYNGDSNANNNVIWEYKKGLTYSYTVINEQDTPNIPIEQEKINPNISWSQNQYLCTNAQQQIPLLLNPDNVPDIKFYQSGDYANNITLDEDTGNITFNFDPNDLSEDISATIYVEAIKYGDDTYNYKQVQCKLSLDFRKTVVIRDREYYYYYVGTDTRVVDVFTNDNANKTINFETKWDSLIRHEEDERAGWRYVNPNVTHIEKQIRISDEAWPVSYYVIVPSQYIIKNAASQEQSQSRIGRYNINDITYNPNGETVEYDVYLFSNVQYFQYIIEKRNN